MEGFVAGIKAKYRDSLRSQVEQQRQPHYHPNKLLQLTLVPRKQGEHNNFAPLSSTPRRCKEETANRSLLVYGDLFKPAENEKRNLVPIRKVLLEGGAGIGKTTFCISIAEDWANGKLFQEYELVLFLPLYERKVASSSTLRDLFKTLQKSNSSAVASDISKRKGEGLLMIADGWDVVCESKCPKGSFLHNLLFGDVLCLASVLVTSRPTASAPLHTENSGIDRFVEILGFSKEGVVEYVQSQFNERPLSVDGLLEQMKCNPLLESLCRIPLGCAIICHMWRTHNGFPITMTKLSNEVISRIVSCNVGIDLPSIDALPRNLQKPWQRLCQFAFRTLTRGPTLTSTTDEEINLSDTEIFGLLEYIQCDSILFHFAHPIFREYLAALYVERLLPKLQLHSMHTKTIEFTLFWRYLFGMCNQMNALNHVTQVLCNFLISDNLKYLLCHCAFEARNNDTVCKEVINLMSDKFGSKVINFGNPQTAHDCKAVLYMIHNMPHSACSEMDVCFNSCKLDAEFIDELANVLASKKIRVTALDLSNNHLSDESIANLFRKPASAFYSLEKLFLCNNKITSEGISAIIATLEKSSSRKLKQLDLSFNPLSLSDLHMLQHGVSSGFLCRLEILFLKESLTSDSRKNIQFVMTFSNAIFSHCKHLKRLDLSRNDLGEQGSPVLSKIISRLTSISKSFDLRLNREYMSEVDKSFIKVMEESVRQKGTIDHTVAHGVIVGPGRSGKNSLMNRLMGQCPPDPDTISPSTGVLETVVKVEVKKLLTVAAAVCNLVWKKLDYDEEALELMMTTVRSHDDDTPLLDNTDHELPPDDDDDQDLVTHTSAVVTVEGKDGSAAPIFLPKLRELVKVVKGSIVSKSSRERKGATEKVEDVSEPLSTDIPPVQEGPLDIFKRAVKLRRMDALREHLESSWSLYLTNTGGQMEFQELLPVLVCGPSVFFITFPLHKDLHEHYTVQYQYPDGSEKMYPSPSTLMDEILQTLATIAALDCTGLQYDLNLKPKIFFIGTHKDQILPEAESDDIIEKIDKELQERIKQTSLYEQGSIEFASAPDRLVFTVNNLAKDDSDFQKIRAALQQAIERCEEFTIKCPSTWLIFSLVLRAKHKSSQVLSYSECFNIARDCGISDREELNDALFFIHTRLGLLRYFCVKELNELVVVDPQILFDTITKFVVKTFISDNVKANEMEEFHKRGIFSMKVMERISKKSHNSDAQLPLKWLLHLLNHLKIAAFFKDDKGNEKCFFPSVLFHAPEPLLRIASSSILIDSPPFLVAFRSGFCPRGIPGALITYLTMNEMKSKIIWKLRSSRVYRNQISFRVGPCDITIKILPTHLKVYLDPESGTTDRSKVMVTCKEAYLQLQQAMKSVTMGYRECDYYFAFSCTRPECKDHPHPAEISLDTKTLECIVHDRPSDLPDNYELWMPELDGVPVEQIGQIADFMYEWEGSVAEQLGLSRPEVAAIKKRYPEDLNLQTREALHKWKQKLGTSATSKKLISVFERAGHKDYADNVRQMLVAEDIPSDAGDTTSTYSPKPFPEPKPEFPSIESVSLLSSTTTTTTTVVVEKENRQEQDEEIVHLKAEELKVLEHETENTDSEPDVEPEQGTHSDQSIDKESKQSDEDEDEASYKSQVHTPEEEPQQPSPPASELLKQIQQDSDTEDQPQSPLPESLPDSENDVVQQPIAIDDSIASDQVSRSSELIEDDEDSEGHYDQQYEEPRDPQDYFETMPSASGSTAYGPMKSKGNVPRVHLIVAEDDEEGIVLGEENLHSETVRELDASSIDRKKKLGEGVCSEVYKGTWKNKRQKILVAIKSLKPNSSKEDFLSEAFIMGQFSHPNVVKLYGVVTRVEPVMIVMELMENKSLHHYLKANEKLAMVQQMNIARDVAFGMEYLSALGFVHRNLATRNVLVSKSGMCKIDFDFGLTRAIKESSGIDIATNWTAPEAIHEHNFTTSSDVWSFGILLWEVMTNGRKPYDNIPTMTNIELVDRLKGGYRLEKPANTTDEVYQIMLDCWKYEPSLRPIFSMILQKIEALLDGGNKSATASKPTGSQKKSTIGKTISSSFKRIRRLFNFNDSPKDRTELKVPNILLALETVTNPYLLGIYLGIEPHHLDYIEHYNYSNIERQKIEIIMFWLDNNVECSWKVLADAVACMGCHQKLVDSLRELQRAAAGVPITAAGVKVPPNKETTSQGTELTVPNILLALKEVTEPYLLGIHLGIYPHHLKVFEYDHPKDIERQKIELIKFWLDNHVECSWKVLADAVKCMGCHRKVVHSLWELHLKSLHY